MTPKETGQVKSYMLTLSLQAWTRLPDAATSVTCCVATGSGAAAA